MSFNMAATEELSFDSKSVLSAYGDSLQGNIKIRRKNSINWLQFDPFLIPLHNCSNECLPLLKAADLLSNLLLDTSVCTLKGQFKNFRSLQSHNHMVSRFISSVLGRQFGDKYLVKYNRN